MADQEYFVVFGLGPDRPGIVASATRFLTERGANVQDSRAAVLGGEFGLMILASGERGVLQRISGEMEALGLNTGLAIQVRQTVSPEAHRRARALPYRVEANAMDHEGIVHAITDVLSSAGINIVSMETSVRNAPVTGTELFSLVAKVDVPHNVAVQDVRTALAQVALAQNLDVEMRPE